MGGLDVRVTGGADLRDVQARLRQLGDKGLGRQMAAALRKAARPLRPAVIAEAKQVMPSGYVDVLTKSLRFRTAVKEGRHSAAVTVRVYGDGQQERRDVPRLNKGELRHPNPGGRLRRRLWTTTKPRKRIPGGQLVRNDWSVTRIRKGFVDRPTDLLMPQMRKEMQTVIDDVARQIGAR